MVICGALVPARWSRRGFPGVEPVSETEHKPHPAAACLPAPPQLPLTWLDHHSPPQKVPLLVVMSITAKSFANPDTQNSRQDRCQSEMQRAAWAHSQFQSCRCPLSPRRGTWMTQGVSPIAPLHSMPVPSPWHPALKSESRGAILRWRPLDVATTNDD